jgi:RNA polymerase sigma-70 factor (ECF subfamily)
MAQNKPGTDQLVELAASGNESAADALLERCRPRLLRMVAVRMDPQISARLDPSDVVQEALTEAYQRLPDYFQTRPISFYPWLRQIAWQRLLKLHRAHRAVQRRSVRREANEDLPLSDASVAQLAERVTARDTEPHHRLVRSELRERVRLALSQLEPADRELLVMRYLEHMPLKQIAEFLSVTFDAAKKRHARALERLESRLSDERP